MSTTVILNGHGHGINASHYDSVTVIVDKREKPIWILASWVMPLYKKLFIFMFLVYQN